MVDHLINVNLKVLLMDTDYFALQAINGYLAWDRRTRVTYLAESEAAMWEYLAHTPLAELPDVVVLDADHLGGAGLLRATIDRLRARIDDVTIVCLAQIAEPALIEAAAESGAKAFVLKGEVRGQIAWAIVYAHTHDFLVTGGIARMAAVDEDMHTRVRHAYELPKPYEYPQLTGRVRQAIELCVIKGMPAVLAADEMSISLHTIRSYIKEGYRILEAADEGDYPVDMSPQERAFVRLTRPRERDD
jgi:DNA-binding NarL/FixJ family response regulator